MERFDSSTTKDLVATSGYPRFDNFNSFTFTSDQNHLRIRGHHSVSNK